MAMFRWEGVSPRGETIRGEMEAPTRDAVITRLRTQRIQPVTSKIRERGKGFDKEISIPGLAERIKGRDIVIFTRQFATMIDAGLPIVEVPVTFVERQHGASKMTMGIVVEALWRVTVWGLARRFRRSSTPAFRRV